jgi:hypothetical protein
VRVTVSNKPTLADGDAFAADLAFARTSLVSDQNVPLFGKYRCDDGDKPPNKPNPRNGTEIAGGNPDEVESCFRFSVFAQSRRCPSGLKLSDLVVSEDGSFEVSDNLTIFFFTEQYTRTS